MRWLLLFCLVACSRSSLPADIGSGDPDTAGDPGGDGVVIAPQLVVGTVNAAISDRWNTYVAYSGGSLLTLDGTACAAQPTYRDCIHAGEIRRLDVADVGSCSGVSATDSLGAFVWTCIEHDGFVSLVSSGFAAGKGLRDLIDFTTPAFRAMNLTVQTSSGVIASADSVWWSNPVLNVPADAGDGTATLDSENSVYVIADDRATGGLTIGVSGIALVTAPQAHITMSDGPQQCLGFVFGSDVTEAAQCAVLTSGERVWLEIDVGAPAAYEGVSVNVQQTRLLRMHRTYFRRNAGPLIVLGLTAGRLIDTTVDNSGTVLFSSTSGSLVRNLRLASSASYFLNCNDNAIEDLTVFGNFAGITLDGGNHDNHFIRTLSFAHSSYGMQFVHADNVRNTFVAYTFADSGNDGLGAFSGLARNTFHLGVVVNTSYRGLQLATSVNDTFSHLVSSQVAYHTVNLDGSASLNRFAGNLRLGLASGNACNISSTGTSPGLTATCGAEGHTTLRFTQTTLETLAASFVGRVSDDAVNTSDSSTEVPVPADMSTFDLIGAENRYRGWVAYSTSGFLSTSERNCVGHTSNGCWSDTAQSAVIADWRLRSDDTLIRNTTLRDTEQNAAFVDGAACPGELATFIAQDLADGELVGNDDGICDVGETCSGNTYLLAAIEIIDDYLGDDDGLCESHEACVYAPNYGAYQGEGDYRSHLCALADDVVVDVTMYGYPQNGGAAASN